jgi:hypothetical protein
MQDNVFIETENRFSLNNAFMVRFMRLIGSGIFPIYSPKRGDMSVGGIAYTLYLVSLIRYSCCIR